MWLNGLIQYVFLTFPKFRFSGQGFVPEIINEKDLKDASKQMREYLDRQHDDQMKRQDLIEEDEIICHPAYAESLIKKDKEKS